MNLNQDLFLAIFSLSEKFSFFSPVMIFASLYLIWIIVGIFLLYFLFSLRGRLTSGRFDGFKIRILVPLVALGIVLVTDFILSSLVQTPRPFVVLGVEPVISHQATPSFPSSHAAISTAAAVGVFLENKILGIILILAAVLVGFSRVYLGVHWPVDTLAGMAIGGASAFISVRLMGCLDKYC